MSKNKINFVVGNKTPLFINLLNFYSMKKSLLFLMALVASLSAVATRRGEEDYATFADCRL